ncbi:MAG: TIM barrel protein [Nitrosarchaeum sp.]
MNSMVYVSTNCLEHPKNVLKVLTEYQKGGIENVELGSVHEYFNIKILKEFNFNFLIHNYFPPPKIPFNFNLSSENDVVRKKSLKLAENAIDLCSNIESPLYTFHAGFTVDPPKLGKPLPRINLNDRGNAIKIFVDGVEKIVDYANSRGIKVAMEPNVVQKFNLIENQNDLCLFAEYQEIEKLFKILKKTSLGLLVDLGHTSVTSHWLKFDKDEFVQKCSKYTYALHVSNNNGLQDQHRSLTKSCWAISKLREFREIPIILETMNLSIEKIKENIQIVKNEIK